ncbi:MAG: hypothetical protein FWH18_04350 [Marinilabiliaceae bacterium]|nr:hypothetical protein [Marinilabiliaceae bacterium]
MKQNKKFAQIFHFDLYGKREDKFKFLLNNSINKVQWNELQPNEPNYFFVPKNIEFKEEYEKGFKVSELFPIHNTGLQTDRDKLFIDNDRKKLENRIKILLSGNYDIVFKQKFRIQNSSSYKLLEIIKGKHFDASFIEQVEYRPFDRKWIYYTPEIISRSASKVMKHIEKKDNIALVFSRQFGGYKHFICFITNKLIERSSQPFAPYSVFPLYLYSDKPDKQIINDEVERVPNFNETIINEISERLGLQYSIDTIGTPLAETQTTFAPIAILDYIYAVLHSPSYREKYKEFLKIDFPRVPYPTNPKIFWNLVELGSKLRHLHLMEGVDTKLGIADYPVDGSNKVEKVIYKRGIAGQARNDGNGEQGSAGQARNDDSVGGRVYINDTQYFDNVPLISWNFYIGGYQPAQKWLKDRKDRTLDYDDVRHYQKIIFVLTETEKLMKLIENH